MLLSLWKTYSRSKLKILLREESYVLIRTFSKRNMIRRKLAQILKIGVTVVFNYGVSRFLHHVSSENLRVSIFTWWWWTLDVFVLLSAFFLFKRKNQFKFSLCISIFYQWIICRDRSVDRFVTEVQKHDRWFRLIDCEIGVSCEWAEGEENDVHQISVTLCREIIYDILEDSHREGVSFRTKIF